MGYLNTSTNPRSEHKYTYENGKIIKIETQLDGGAYFSEWRFLWTNNHVTLQFQQEGFWLDTTFIEIDLNANGYLEKYGEMSLYYDTNMVLDSIIDDRVGRENFYLFDYEANKLNEVLT